ncbi:MAG: hypothetical protein ACC726_09820 [Chloroflexota bacterium]
MSTVRTAVVTTAAAAAPRGALIRLRWKISLDMLVTLLVTILAVGLIVGYQVLSRIGPGRTARAR